MLPNESPESGRLAYSVPGLSKATDIPVSTLWAYIQSGQLEAVKVGRHTRIMRPAAEAFLRAGVKLNYQKKGVA